MRATRARPRPAARAPDPDCPVLVTRHVLVSRCWERRVSQTIIDEAHEEPPLTPTLTRCARRSASSTAAVMIRVAVIRPSRGGHRHETPDGIGAPGRDRTGD